MTGLSDEPQRVPAGALLEGSGELWALQLDAKATFDRLVAPLRRRRRGARPHPPEPDLRATCPARSPAPRSTWRSSASTSWSRRPTSSASCSTPRPRPTRSTSSTPPSGSRASSRGAPCDCCCGPPAPASGIGWRLLHAGSGTVLSLLERLTGAQLLRDVGDFLSGFDGMYQGFADRAQAIRALLLSDSSAFVVVSAPGGDPLAPGRRADAPAGGGALPARRRRAQPRAPPAPRRPAGGRRPGRRARRRPRPRAASPSAPPRPSPRSRCSGCATSTPIESLRGAIDDYPVIDVPAFAREPVELEGHRRGGRGPRAVSPPRVVVLGAGVVGAACARALADGGAEVRVIDPGAGRAAASWAAAGILSPSHPEELPDALHRPRGDRSRELWERPGPAPPARSSCAAPGWCCWATSPRWLEWRARARPGGGAGSRPTRRGGAASPRSPRSAARGWRPALLGDIPVERTPPPHLEGLRRERRRRGDRHRRLGRAAPAPSAGRGPRRGAPPRPDDALRRRRARRPS